MAANRGRFGLVDLPSAPPFEFGEIAVPAGTPLRVVAKAAGVPLSVLRDYNPDLLRDVVPGAGGDALVAIPADRIARAMAAFPALYAREVRDAGAEAEPSAVPSTKASAKTAPSAKVTAAPREPPKPGDAASEARFKAGEARRKVLEKVPYGSSWLLLGERLFPPGHPLAGAVLNAPLLPLLSVAIADRADWAMGEGPAIAPHLHEERASQTLPVPSPRVIFAWIGPPLGDSGGAAVKLALLLLAHHDFGRVSRALIQEKHVAVHLRGLLDIGDRGSVAALEAVPAVQYDVERGRGAGVGETKEETLARIQRTRERSEAATGEELRALLKEVFTRDKRVVVTSSPRGSQ